MDDHDTEPHDVGEWLDGYNRGVLAGRRDVLQLLSALVGTGDMGTWLIAAIIGKLEMAH
jgi:hypothetical protein